MPIGDAVMCEEHELVDVFPQYITFSIREGRPKGVAHMHKNMALLKSFITTHHTNQLDGALRTHVKVFENVKGKLHLLYDLPQGSFKKDSDLWRKKPSKRAVVVDEDEVDAAIQSILKGGVSDGTEEA